MEAYKQKVSEVDAVEEGLMAEAEQFFVLTQYDRLWKDHLQAIKFLQTAVGLRGYAQRDPITEFKLEGYQLFLEMMAQVRLRRFAKPSGFQSWRPFRPTKIFEERVRTTKLLVDQTESGARSFLILQLTWLNHLRTNLLH